MNKKKFTFIVAFFLLVTMGFVLSVQADQPLVMVFNETVSKPWKWKQDGKFIGPFIDIIHEVARRSGLTVTLEPMPWKRALAEVKSGRVDGFFGGYKTPDREDFATFLDEPIGWATLSVFVRKGEGFSFQRIEDLYGKKIGIVRGYTNGMAFDRAAMDGRISLSEVNSYSSLIMMLDLHRVDGIVGASETILAHLTDMKMTERFEKLPHPIESPKPVYICISKHSKLPNRHEVIARMNRAMETMKEERIFEEIFHYYSYMSLGPK